MPPEEIETWYVKISEGVGAEPLLTLAKVNGLTKDKKDPTFLPWENSKNSSCPHYISDFFPK